MSKSTVHLSPLCVLGTLCFFIDLMLRLFCQDFKAVHKQPVGKTVIKNKTISIHTKNSMNNYRVGKSLPNENIFSSLKTASVR